MSSRYKDYHTHALDEKYKRLARIVYKKCPIIRPVHDKIILEAKSSSSILDIGCGRGNFLKKCYYYRDDLRLSACDIEDVLENDIRNKVEFKILDLNTEKLPFAEATFDVIICSHVIEHLSNPFFVFQEIIRVLKPRGVLILETPSLRSLFIPCFFPNYFKDNPTINFFDDPTHIRPYTRTSLLRLAKMAGFSEYKVSKSRNILNILAFPLAIIKFLKKDGALLSGFVGTAFGTINLLIAKK